MGALINFLPIFSPSPSPPTTTMHMSIPCICHLGGVGHCYAWQVWVPCFIHFIYTHICYVHSMILGIKVLTDCFASILQQFNLYKNYNISVKVSIGQKIELNMYYKGKWPIFDTKTSQIWTRTKIITILNRYQGLKRKVVIIFMTNI
jgi:hypothetical protein